MTAAAAAAPLRLEKDDISFAAWSINRSFFVGKRWKNIDLPRIVKREFGINGIEFVNQFFDNPTLNSLRQLKKAGADEGVKFVLIMIDNEGDMSAQDAAERRTASVMHRKWVDVAHFLGCHAVRCNLGGYGKAWEQDKDLPKRAAESFHDLLKYAEGSGLNVVIENHGGASSNADVLVSIMKEVNHPRFGTLPDFGNINKGDDHEEVIRKIVPWAKGISVKAGWKEDGTHPGYSVEKLISICQEAGFRGWWGIESGMRIETRTTDPEAIWKSESQAVMWTKAVIEKTVLKKG
jgi:sugar phosphate isomerase/epimerase